MLKFSDIEFGKSSGENESSNFPELVKLGFYEISSVLKKIKTQSDFLILGNKGTGKSLLAEKLRLDSESSDVKYSVIIEQLKDFPYSRFHKIYPSGGAPQEKYPASWSWILLMIIINYIKSSSSNVQLSDFSKQNIEILESCGLFPVESMSSLVVTSSKKTSSIKLSEGINVTEEVKSEQSKLNFVNTVNILKKIAVEILYEREIFLIIDGLDDINATKEHHFETLNALIFEASRLNNYFKSIRKKLKIIILCRIDLFEQLPSANKNKIRQDSSVLLNWYDEHAELSSTNLVLLANKKASISLKDNIDIFQKFFNTHINGSNIVKFLLSNTRYTPRDFIQLLNFLKSSYSKGKFDDSQIMSALKRYSIEYFLPEVRDEIVGHVNPDDFDKFILLLGEMKKREFSWGDIIISSEKNNVDIEKIKLICNTLFNCGVIGNKWRRGDAEDMYEFKYRNRNAIFDTSKRIVLHRAIWKSLNIT